MFLLCFLVGSLVGGGRGEGWQGEGGVLQGCLLSLLFGVLFYPREGREGG